MTRLSKRTVGAMAAALGALLFAAEATPAKAQCATCVTPTVAYSPVVVQPAPVVRTGWYPGYWIDRMRLRRWSAAPAAPTYAAAYAPAYTAAYAPTYTAAYAPAATYTAAYAPYVTAYAPMQQAVVQTSYAPSVAVSAAPCTSCAQTTVGYAPTTVYRPVEVAPVAQTIIAAPACAACSVEAPCGGCSTCTPAVSQVSYVESAPAADCPSCAATPSEPYYGSAPAASSTTSGPLTPRPELGAEIPTPAAPNYGAPAASSAQKPESSVVDPKPEADDAAGPEAEPEADPAADASTSYEFQAPPLIAPQNDRTANRPTVDVHNAVYSQPARQGRVSTTAAKVSAASQAAPATDANGWYSVSER